MRQKDPQLMESISTYISDYYLQLGRTPSTAEIARELGICKATAYNYLVEMDAKGMLEYKDGKVTTSSMEKIKVEREPVMALGKIACGEPAQEEENLLYRTSLPTAIFGRGPFYILYAKGDSMVDADIEEGDILVIRKNGEPHVGDIIVALDENSENTLKLFGGIDPGTGKAILKYQNKAVYGDKVILVNELVCQGVLSHIIKER